MMSTKMIKIIGTVVTIVSAGLSVVGAFVEDKKMEQKIEEIIADKLKEG